MRNPSNVLVIDGHPDPNPTHLVHALADSCLNGARSAGHDTARINLAEQTFPLLREPAAWEEQPAPESLRPCQEMITRASHLILVYPLWLGGMPAYLKGFLEQVLRPGFAIPRGDRRAEGLLKGKSARLVVTMGMPAWFYRWFYGAWTVKSLERNILRFAGIWPCRHTLVGSVGGLSEAERAAWLKRAEALGAEAR